MQFKEEELSKILFPACADIRDWTNEREMLENFPALISAIEEVLKGKIDAQTPLVLQPVWRTKGKSPELADNCLDVFVWSNLGFTRLFLDTTIAKISKGALSINRQMRTTLWLVKMLFDYSQSGRIDAEWVIDEMTYNTKNDKAFAVSGSVTQPYMASPELKKPRVSKDELKKIILNGGHQLLSPERRFDAIIFYSSDIFS